MASAISALEIPHFQPIWKNPLHQPASFCQTSWWSPYLNPPPARWAGVTTKHQSSSKKPVCVCVRGCVTSVLTRQAAAGDIQKLSSRFKPQSFRFSRNFLLVSFYFFSIIFSLNVAAASRHKKLKWTRKQLCCAASFSSPSACLCVIKIFFKCNTDNLIK